ncbi:hypothetical protein [Streptomyces sp. NPDC021212]|uniref:hypothetical protein n=1 Tax=Streptomyces sp. NPDC021212 TaxID=3365118 RepID=UPI0037BD9C11
MAEERIRKQIADSALDRVTILVNILLDLALVGAWFTLLWLFDIAFGSIKQYAEAEWDVRLGKAFFAISLLVAIAIILYWDLRTIHRRLSLRFHANGQ